MKLSNLLEGLISVPPEMDTKVANLTLDSRHIHPHDLFLAVQGTHLDGRQYIAEAISRGANAILVNAETKTENVTKQAGIPLIPIFELRKNLGLLGARFYQYPAKQLPIMGVTGTNGKTTCTHFIAQILQNRGMKCGVIGTLGSGLYGELQETGLTTPDAITLQKTLHSFFMQNAQAVAMEVSSHSIDQGRINEIIFETAIFTNLTQDHLDYHGDMETYAGVKYKFLNEIPHKHLVINADDSYGQKWIPELSLQQSVYAYSTEVNLHPIKNVEFIYADKIELSFAGIKAHIHSPWGKAELYLPLIGLFNLSNALAALTALCLHGIPFHEVIEELHDLHPVPGRMQRLVGEGSPLIVIDYAHTPDALEKALQALRRHTQAKLVCVFGCGGDRDKSKRPLMAKIAEQWADQVIVTSDNPRHENPETIAKEIMQGFVHPEKVWVELDRSKAIEKSIQWASGSDCILIAGKGAERYQHIGDEKFPFEDAEKVSGYLNV